MNALLIPVKDLRNAKQRLATHLSQPERTALAQAMFEDFCAAAAGIRVPQEVFLVSNYEPAIEMARRLNWKVILEGKQESESASVDYASRICAERGVTSLARVPIDLPLVTASDIDALFQPLHDAKLQANHPNSSLVIVPSRCGTGTNALLRTPPTLFPSHFGPGSFAKHLDEAKKCEAQVTILRNERLELDVDDWDDLQALAARTDLPQHIVRWLKSAGIAVNAELPGGNFGADGTKIAASAS